MPDPDGQLQNRDFADKVITDRMLDDNLTTDTFTATATFTGPYETSNAGDGIARIVIADGILWGFTGDTEETAPGILKTYVSGSGDSRTLQTVLWVPSFLDDVGSSFLVLRSASFDDSTSPPGLVIGTNGTSTQTAEFRFQNSVALRLQPGSDAFFEGELQIPAATSDPSTPSDGNFYVNTSTNALKLYEGGSWRTIASW